MKKLVYSLGARGIRYHCHKRRHFSRRKREKKKGQE